MDPDAYRRLDEFGLPRPRTFTAQELLRLEDVPRVLLRGGHAPGRPGFFSPREAAARILASSKKDQQANEAIVSDAGGCAVIRSTGTYVELAEGHLSGLLRDGWCSARFWKSKGPLRSIPVRQEFAVDYRSLQPKYRLATGTIAQLIDKVLAMVLDYARRLPPDTLVEFIITSQLLPIFVDLKAYPWPIDFGAIFTSADSIYDSTTTPVRTWFNCPCAAEFAGLLPHGAGVALNSGAALSHFITYGLKDQRIVTVRK